MIQKKPAVFIGRDGILNKAPAMGKYAPEALRSARLIEESYGPLELIRPAGFKLIVIVSQPQITTGELMTKDLQVLHQRIRERFRFITDIFCCPHAEEDRCPCRPPNPGLLKEAGHKWTLDLDQSFFVSPRLQDAAAARAAGCTPILLSSPLNGKYAAKSGFSIVPNIQAAVSTIFKIRDQFACHI